MIPTPDEYGLDLPPGSRFVDPTLRSGGAWVMVVTPLDRPAVPCSTSSCRAQPYARHRWVNLATGRVLCGVCNADRPGWLRPLDQRHRAADAAAADNGTDVPLFDL